MTPDPSPAPIAAPPLPKEESRLVGTDEDRYRRSRLMGSGGMAEVYLAHDGVLDRDVTLKVLRIEYADDEQVVERFEREARNVASLSHPNIVAIHYRGQTRDGSYFMVMECFPGDTLKERFQEEDALPAPSAVEFALQIARTLQAAHRRGVIHRNIKPQNVLLAQSGEAKVADFGIARVVSSTFVTRTGALLGTAHYISPEQALGQPATFQSDLYSLGVVLYETLAEEVPHGAETSIGLAMKHVNGLLRPPREVNASIPEGLNAVVMRLLDKDPEQRYGDTDELMADLERMGQGESPVTRQEDGNSPAFQENVLDHAEVGPTRTPQAPPPRGKRLVLMATAVGPLLVLLTGGGAMALTGLGPAAGLLGGSKNEPADESSSAQPPDVQEDVVAEVEAVEVESAEQTTSSSDDSTGTSGTLSDGGDAVQGPAAQTDQGSPTAEVAPPPGNAKQKSTTPTMEEDSSSVEVPNLTGLPVSDPFV